jgi:hypothetical protein
MKKENSGVMFDWLLIAVGLFLIGSAIYDLDKGKLTYRSKYTKVTKHFDSETTPVNFYGLCGLKIFVGVLFIGLGGALLIYA